MVSPLQAIQLKFCIPFSSLPRAIHVLPINPSSLNSPNSTWCKVYMSIASQTATTFWLCQDILHITSRMWTRQHRWELQLLEHLVNSLLISVTKDWVAASLLMAITEHRPYTLSPQCHGSHCNYQRDLLPHAQTGRRVGYSKVAQLNFVESLRPGNASKTQHFWRFCLLSFKYFENR